MLPVRVCRTQDHHHKQSVCSISFCLPCSAGVPGCGIAPQTRMQLISITSHSLHGGMQRLANMQQSKWHLLLYLPSSADHAGAVRNVQHTTAPSSMVVVCRRVTFKLGRMALSHHNSQFSCHWSTVWFDALVLLNNLIHGLHPDCLLPLLVHACRNDLAHPPVPEFPEFGVQCLRHHQHTGLCSQIPCLFCFSWQVVTSLDADKPQM